MIPSYRLHVRIYYEDTDSGGVVYHANYLKYMERGRTETLRSMGYELDQLQQHQDLIFAVTRADIRYKRPALYNDLLEVDSQLQGAAGARLYFSQSIWRLDAQTKERQELLSDADIALAAIDGKGKPKRIPAELLQTLQQHLSHLRGDPA